MILKLARYLSPEMNRTAKSILIVFAATFCVALLLLYLPVNRVWFAILVSVIATILYRWFDPAHRFGRLAVYCVSVAAASAAWPGLTAWIKFNDAGEGKVTFVEVAPEIPLGFLAAGVLFGVLQAVISRRSEHGTQESSTNEVRAIESISGQGHTVTLNQNNYFQSPSEPTRINEIAVPENTIEPSHTVEEIQNAYWQLGSWITEYSVVDSDWIPRDLDWSDIHRFESHKSSIKCLFGEPGSGKTTFLAMLGLRLRHQGHAILPIKADFFPPDTQLENWIQELAGLTDPVSTCVEQVADQKPLIILIDQLDALSSLIDLQSDRLNQILTLIRSCRALQNVHIVCSARPFEYNYDIRLKTLDAERIDLSLPAFDQVKPLLESAGLVDPQSWPDDVKESLRNPQHLQIFLEYQELGSGAEVGVSYQQMLDAIWKQRVDSPAKRECLNNLVEWLIDRESLWMPESLLEKQSDTVDQLIADGLLTRQKLCVGFRHQTLLEHARARHFTQSSRSLVDFVFERQDAIFVRPTLWAVLTYLRAANPEQYQSDLVALFQSDIRLHVRTLLIDFLGQQHEPTETEESVMGERLQNLQDRARALSSTTGSQGWFTAFASSHLPTAMGWPENDAWSVVRVIEYAWSFAPERCLQLLQQYWLHNPAYQSHAYYAIRNNPVWNEQSVEFVCSLVRSVENPAGAWMRDLVGVISTGAPTLAGRVMRVVLEKQLTTSDRSLLEGDDWYDAEEIASAGGIQFFRDVWPAIVHIAEHFHTNQWSENANLYQGGLFFLDRETLPRPLLSAIILSIELVANEDPEEFLCIVRESFGSENAVVHALISSGLARCAATYPDVVLEYLLGDGRRLSLGIPRNAERAYAAEVVEAVTPAITVEQARRLESAILEWSIYKDEDESSGHKNYNEEARHALLARFPDDKLSAKMREQVSTRREELREWIKGSGIQSRFGSVRDLPPMSIKEIQDSSEDVVLDTLRGDLADERAIGEWNEEEQCFLNEGGPRAAGRELGKLAVEDFERFAKLLRKAIKEKLDVPAAEALRVARESKVNSKKMLDLIESMNWLKERAVEELLRTELSLTLKDFANEGLPDWACKLLETWVFQEWSRVTEDHPNRNGKDEEYKPGSTLWGDGGGLISCGNCYWALAALYRGLLNRPKPDADWFLRILERLAKHACPTIAWRHYLVLFSFARAEGVDHDRVHKLLSYLFSESPELAQCSEAAVLIANLAWVLPIEFVQQFVEGFLGTDDIYCHRTAGELIGLFALQDSGQSDWACERVEGTLGNDSEVLTDVGAAFLVGITTSTTRGLDEISARATAVSTLVKLADRAAALPEPWKHRLAEAFGGIFHTQEDWPSDDLSSQMIQTLSKHIELVAPDYARDLADQLRSGFVHRRLDSVRLCIKLASHFGKDLSNISSSLAMAAEPLVDIAMTAQRFNDSRSEGLELLELLLDFGVNEATTSLTQVDLRPKPGRPRPTIRRRRRRRRR